MSGDSERISAIHFDTRSLETRNSEIEHERACTRDEGTDAFETGTETTSFRATFAIAVAHHMLRWWLETDDG